MAPRELGLSVDIPQTKEAKGLDGTAPLKKINTDKGKEVAHQPWIVTVALRIPCISLIFFIGLAALCTYWAIPFFDLSEPLAGLRLVYDETAEKADGWVMGYQELREEWDNEKGNVADVKVIQQSSQERCLTFLFISHNSGNVFTPEGLATMKKIEDSVLRVNGYEDFCHRDANSRNCKTFDTVFNYLDSTKLGTQQEIDVQLGELWAGAEDVKRFFQSSFAGAANPASNMTRSRVCFGLPLAGFRNPEDRRDEQKDILGEYVIKAYEDMLTSYYNEGTPQTGDITVYYFQPDLADSLTKTILGEDVLKCVLAVGVVWLVMLIHMRSLFLSSLALLQVLLSFPVAFFIYRIVLGIELFGGLQAVAIFIVLGVGADDCFIYVDAFKETVKLSVIPGWGLPERLSFAYKRAQFTMLVTTCTTGFAFTMLAISSIPTVRYFGVFAALLIVSNYCMVMTLYTCVLVLWDRNFRKLRFKKLCSRGCSRLTGKKKNGSSSKMKQDLGPGPDTESVVSKNDVDGDDDSDDDENRSTSWAESPRYANKPRKDSVLAPGESFSFSAEKEAGTGVLGAMKQSLQNLFHEYFEYEEDFVDEALTADDARSVMTGNFTPRHDGGASTPRYTGSVRSFHSTGSSTAHAAAAPGPEKMDVQEFTWWARTLTRKGPRRAVLSFFGVLVLVAVVLTSQLEIANEENPFWPEEHFFWWYTQSVPLAFHDAKDRPRIDLYLVHGLREPFANRTGTKETIKEDFGSPIYEAEFDLSAPVAQQRVADECKMFFTSNRNLFLSSQDGEKSAKCFMVAFQLWREARQDDFPMPLTDAVAPVLGEISQYPTEAALDNEPFEQELKEFLSRAQFEPFKNVVSIAKMGGENGTRPRVKFLFSLFRTTLSWDDSFAKRSEVVEAYDSFQEEVLQQNVPRELGAPESVYVTSFDYFIGWKTQWLFLFNSFTSMALSIAITLVFLFMATNNIRIALLSGVTIVGISFTVLGFVVVVGWKLDTIISVAITLLVGFIADYCVHLAVAYDEANRECGIHDRMQKVDHVVKTMSISIAAGAASTFGASTMLFPTTVRFFAQFGGFLSVAVATAVTWSLIFFPALMAQFGPDGKDGAVAPCLKNKRTIGLYDLAYHKPRSSKGSRVAIAITLLFYICLAGGAVLFYGIRTGSFGFELELEEEPFVPSPFAVFPTRAGDAPGSSMPSIQDMDLDSWYKLSPAGETGCARGEPFSFFFKRGADSNAPVIVEFQGGAPCWNEATCAADKLLITDSIDLLEGKIARVARGEEQLEGFADPAGPLSNAHHLYVPQCTGDYFWGNRTHAYTEETVIEHRGSLNAIAMLRWLLPELADHLQPQSVMFTGTDTGAYASILYANIMAAWLDLTGRSETTLVQHGDSGLGVFAPGFFEDAIEAWGATIATEDVQFVVGNETINVPLTLLQPNGLEDLLNVTSNFNFTALNDCLAERQSNATSDEPLTNQELTELLLAADRDQLVEACVNETAGPGFVFESFFNEDQPFDINDIWADLGVDDPFNFTGGTNATDNSLVDASNRTNTGTTNLTDVLKELCEEEENAGNLQAGFCLNITKGVNGTALGDDFTAEDLQALSENVQVIPSMYLLSALRYQRHIFSQFSTAYDYESTRQLAMQYLGKALPGVTYNEQKVFHKAVIAVYDAFLKTGFRLPNYRHFFVASDFHGHLDADRHYRVVDNSLYQVLYAWLYGADTQGLPLEYDCRDQGEDACLRGVDTREATQYFYDEL